MKSREHYPLQSRKDIEDLIFSRKISIIELAECLGASHTALKYAEEELDKWINISSESSFDLTGLYKQIEELKEEKKEIKKQYEAYGQSMMKESSSRELEIEELVESKNKEIIELKAEIERLKESNFYKDEEIKELNAESRGEKYSQKEYTKDI